MTGLVLCAIASKRKLDKVQLNVKFTMKGTTPLHLTRATLVCEWRWPPSAKKKGGMFGWEIAKGDKEWNVLTRWAGRSRRAASGKPTEVLPVEVRKPWAKAIRW